MGLATCTGGLFAQRAVLSGVRRAIPKVLSKENCDDWKCNQERSSGLRELSSEELDAVSGGLLFALLQVGDIRPYIDAAQQPGGGSIEGGQQGGQNDPAQMFQQIMQQLPRAGKRAPVNESGGGAPRRNRAREGFTRFQGGKELRRMVRTEFVFCNEQFSSSLTMARQLLELKKAAAIVVTSKELADFPARNSCLPASCQKAVIAATDTNFLAALVAATTPTASAGSSLANIVTDLGVLLGAVTTSSTSKVFYVTSVTNMKKLVLKSNSVGSPAFPGLTLSGGEVFGGVTAIASDSIPFGAALMFAADAIVGNADAILPGKSEQSTLQMESTSPDSPPVAGTVLLSLRQNDLLALRMEQFFGFTVMRASGVASLSGVSY